MTGESAMLHGLNVADVETQIANAFTAAATVVPPS